MAGSVGFASSDALFMLVVVDPLVRWVGPTGGVWAMGQLGCGGGREHVHIGFDHVVLARDFTDKFGGPRA
jgi:hypothetical protein